MPIDAGDTVTGLAGTYRIDSRHGEGAFGITYRAWDVARASSVIVKELRIERLDDWKALELFEREARVLSSLSHPHIPAFCDFFAHGGPTPLPVQAMRSNDGPDHLSLVLVQVLIEGATLQQRIDQRRPFSPFEAEHVLRALLGALVYLHERIPPLVHRDIKPGNIVLAPDGRPYLVDFGAIQERLRSAGSVGSTIVGTLGYMPLEQIRGDARPASDLYALGVTMIVALAGRPLAELPFDDASGKVSLTGTLPAETPANLRDALDAMVAPLLGQRAASARDVLALLDSPSRASSRRRWPLLMVAGLATLIASGAGLSMAIVVPPPRVTPSVTPPPRTVDPKPAVPESPFVSGQVWTGSYVCYQGKTDLSLDIVEVDHGHVDAIFDFHHAPTGAHGKFRMTGQYLPEDRELDLEPGEWLESWKNYVTVGLKGRARFREKDYVGNVVGPGCTTFSLHLKGTQTSL